jgi:hypothetical protein
MLDLKFSSGLGLGLGRAGLGLGLGLVVCGLDYNTDAGTGQKHVMKSLNIFLQWVSPIALPVVPLLAM